MRKGSQMDHKILDFKMAGLALSERGGHRSDIGMYQPDMQMFLDIKKKAENIFESLHLPDDVKSYYNEIFLRINSEQDIDLKDPDILKCFLALKKLVKYKDKVSLKIKPGYFNELSPFLGEYNRFYAQLNKTNSIALKRFCDELYKADARFHMIPIEDRKKANVLADEMLKKELQKYGTNPEDTFGKPTSDYRNVVHCYDIDNDYNDWTLHVCLDGGLSQEHGEKYAPFGIIALHELGHVRQTLPGVSEKDFENNKKFAELGPTIDLIVRQDEIYKKIHNIPIEQDVIYPNCVQINGVMYNLGEIANRFRQIQKKYGFDNFEQTLLTTDANVYITGMYDKKSTNTIVELSNRIERK